jgi:valyl-tRNA synthetase
MIRDGKGRKLSKSLGNSPDPLNIIDKYGTDANRFTILYLSPLGQDVKMDVDVKAQDIPSMEIGRNFANKIWNAGRFLLMKLSAEGIAECCPANENKTLDVSELSFADKWLLSRFNTTIKDIHFALDNFKVNDYSKILYDFIWRDFCDWYVEIVKVQLKNSDSPAYRQAFMKHVIGIYENILKLLHPVMPYITEEIWHLLDERDENESISLQAMPSLSEINIDKALEEKFEYLQLIVEEIRRLRASLNIAPSQKIPVIISSKDAEGQKFISMQAQIIAAMSNSSSVKSELNIAKPNSALASVVRETEIFLILEGEIDLDKEKERLNKEIQRLQNNIGGVEKKLTNEKFVNNASPEVVQNEREKLESMKESLKKVVLNLESLG